jgi:RHS repeat-associated protein
MAVKARASAGGVLAGLTYGNGLVLAGGAPLALGYPGQWKDPATGLFQNWHRDYDPTLGRYVEADPIGLGGGSNLYGYVGGNPVNLVDPEGLAPKDSRYQVKCGRCILIYDTDQVKGPHTHWVCPGKRQGCIKKDGSPCDGSSPPPPEIEDCLKKRGRIPQNWCQPNSIPTSSSQPVALPSVPTNESWMGAITAGAIAAMAFIGYVAATTF